jgi:hypothetical protein
MALISPISNRRPSQVLCETLVYEIPVFDRPAGKNFGQFIFLSGHQAVARQCPLSGAKRTLRLTDEMSAYDPKRIFDHLWGGRRPKPDVLLQGHVVRSLSA